MAFASKGNINPIPVNSMKWPSQGATASFIGLFPMPGTFTLELNKHETANKVDLPQSLFFDASTSTGAVVIVFSGSQQTLTLPPQSAGYIPILTPDQPTFTITGAGGGSIGLTFISVPLPASVWSTAAGGATSVTAAQGLPGPVANAWPVTITEGGALVSAGNPLSTADQNLALTIGTGDPDTTPPTSYIAVGGRYFVAPPTLTNGESSNILLTSSGALVTSDAVVEGAITTVGASAASANALQVGGVFNTTPPALNTGQAAALQLTSTSQLIVSDTTTHTTLTAINTSASTIATETTATVTALGNVNSSIASALAPVAPAAATASKSELIGLQYNSVPTEYTTGQQGAALANAYGSLLVDTEVQSPTYSAAAGPAASSGASSQPFFWIRGSPTKTVRIKRICATPSGTGITTPAPMNFTLYRYSGATAFAGSGVTVVNPSTFDTNDAAATATAGCNNTGAITASPAIGTAFRAQVFEIGSSITNAPIEWDFTAGGKSIVLRGTSDWIVIVQTNAAAANVACGLSVDWTEV